MSVFSSSSRPSDEIWKAAIGVLPVERALADEHEALHGEDLSAQLAAITEDFDPGQFTDVPALVRDLRKAIGTSGVMLPAATGPKIRIDTELTPRDLIGRFLLQDDELRDALTVYEALVVAERANGAAAFARALSKRFNALLDQHLMDQPVFRAMIDAGAVAALGDPVTDGSTHAMLLRRANRALLESAFPESIEQMRDRRLRVVFDAKRKRDSAALCLSGGGIRSSTFALGVMQGLARHGLLGKFDYLSTVSGGGLSGGWLTGWMRREGAPAVHAALRSPGHEKIEPEPQPLQGLRSFSHWLTPNAGAMSVDSWTVIATVIRNLLLNWFVLLPLLAGVVLVPRLLQGILAMDLKPPNEYSALFIATGVVLGLVLMLVSAGYVEWVRASGDDFANGKHGAPTQTQVLYWFLIPRVIGSVIIVLALHVADAWDGLTKAHNIWDSAEGIFWWVLGLTAIITIIAAQLRRGKQSHRGALVRSLKALACGFIGYIGPLTILSGWPAQLYVTFAPPMMLLGSVFASQLYAGLTSNEASDAEREWSARANAWIYVVVLTWIVACGLVLVGPHVVSALWQKLTLLGVGGVSSWITVQLGKQAAADTSTTPSAGSKLRGFALALTGPAVIASLIVALATANEASINTMCEAQILKRALSCSPPGYDSTSVPLLDMIASNQLGDANAAFKELTSSLDADSATVPQTNGEAAEYSRADSNRIALSREYTRRVIVLNETVKHLMRRAHDGEVPIAYLASDSAAFMSAFRAFNAHRNRALIAEDTNGAAAALRSPRQHTLTQALITDTTLKADFVQREAGLDTIDLLADSLRRANDGYRPGEQALWLGIGGFMVLLLVAGLFFSSVVNTNTFSLHAMWRSRTVRAFLGTTRPPAARNPNPFTDFDSDDDMPMRDLWPARVSATEAAIHGERSENVPPMHVLNVTLNLAAGRNLAWQQRLGESMTLTPLHAGSAFTGYRRMEGHPKPSSHEEKPKPGYGGDSGISLGTAMAISGAAASPNDGSNTSPVTAFLMTFFNARLGWWLGNPGAPGADTWQRSAPKQRLTPILSEMFANTSDRSQYVYLSDGGHFENLALYEMVLRRNRFIVVSDGGADPDYAFEDLGNAVRKIRIDFGIPIEFDQPVNIRSGDATKGAYWATARIRYSAIDMPPGCTPDDYDGVLVYLKPAVYGTIEPRDVINYANLSPTFPQESSADQFFSESQFESYRALGSWIVDQLVANPGAPGAPVTAKGHREGSLLSSWPNIKEAPLKPKY